MSTPPPRKTVVSKPPASTDLASLVRTLAAIEKEWTTLITVEKIEAELERIKHANMSKKAAGRAKTVLKQTVVRAIDAARAAAADQDAEDAAARLGLPPLQPQAADGAASSTAPAPLSSPLPSATTAIVDSLATLPMPSAAAVHAVPTIAAGYAADVIHEAVACGDEPVALRECFIMLAQDGYQMEQLYADTSIRSAMAADFSGDDTRLMRELRELYHQAGLPMPNFGSTSAGSHSDSGVDSKSHVPLPDVPMPDVPMPDVPMPDVPMPNVPMPDVPLPDVLPDVPAFAPGMCVELHGLLSRPDLNGMHGVLGNQKPNGRWAVQVPAASSILVKPQNLRLVHEVRASLACA